MLDQPRISHAEDHLAATSATVRRRSPGETVFHQGRLEQIVQDIHDRTRETAACSGDPDDYAAGASLSGFLRVAGAMLAQGVV